MNWELWYVLPNVDMANPIETEFVACVGGSDPRLHAIAENCVTCRMVLEGFTDLFGEPVKVSAIIGRSDAPSHLRTEEAVVGFRNVIAMAHVCHCITAGMSQFYPRFSDVFSIYPMQIGRDGGFVAKSSAWTAGGTLTSFSGHCAAHLPHTSCLDLAFPCPAARVGFDPALYWEGEYLSTLLRQWAERFVRRKRSWKGRALFRSLEMAYQAASCPVMNNASYYDVGTLVAMWVSAFECLFHPAGKQEVYLNDVVKRLEAVDCGFEVPSGRLYHPLDWLLHKRYTVRRSRTNLLPKLYEQLYESRNSFLHGNRISGSKLHAFGKRSRPPLLDVAPLIYRFAILSHYPLPRAAQARFRKDLNHSGHNMGSLMILLRAAGVRA